MNNKKIPPYMSVVGGLAKPKDKPSSSPDGETTWLTESEPGPITIWLIGPNGEVIYHRADADRMGVYDEEDSSLPPFRVVFYSENGREAKDFLYPADSGSMVIQIQFSHPGGLPCDLPERNQSVILRNSRGKEIFRRDDMYDWSPTSEDDSYYPGFIGFVFVKDGKAWHVLLSPSTDTTVHIHCEEPADAPDEPEPPAET